MHLVQISDVVMLNFLGHQRRKEFMADINRLKLTHGLSSDVEATDSDSELKNMVVKTKKLALGPWYKCNKGIC